MSRAPLPPSFRHRFSPAPNPRALAVPSPKTRPDLPRSVRPRRAKANPGKAADKKAKNDAKREGRAASGSQKTFA